MSEGLRERIEALTTNAEGPEASPDAARRAVAELVRAALGDQREKALALQKRFEPLMEMNFWESSPGPVKCALALMKKCGETLRLPLVPVREETRKRIEKMLASYKLLAKKGERSR